MLQEKGLFKFRCEILQRLIEKTETHILLKSEKRIGQ
jgi:hypothetical protein